jgi:hypothetical protein
MNEPIFLPVIVEGIGTRADRTLKITLGTQELTPAEAGRLFSLHQSAAYVMIKEELFNSAERDLLDKIQADATEYNGKTPSQRLRNVLYRVYETDPQSFNDFTRYYEYQMERLISHFKNKIEGDVL